MSNSTHTCVLTSTTCRFRETAFLEDISTGLIRPTQSLQHNMKFITTHACLLVLFICSFVFPVRAGASGGLSSTSELEASDGPGGDKLLPLLSSASCLSNVRFAFTSTPKGTDARSSAVLRVRA